MLNDLIVISIRCCKVLKYKRSTFAAFLSWPLSGIQEVMTEGR